MKIIVGLGNPGKEYEKTRHNTGWMVLDEIAKLLKSEPFRKNSKFRSLLSEGKHGEEKFLMIKPETFMNLSGEAVLAISSFYKAKNEDIWIVYDDLDLPLGQIRIRKEGSGGTHNGMKSIVQNMGKNLPRFRIGIEARNAEQKQQIDAASYVLAPFSAAEKEAVHQSINKGTHALLTALESGIEEAMDQYNR